MIGIGSGGLSAAINPLGAELSSLRDADGRELMTDGDPAYWTGRSPLLFPIVGELNGGVYRFDGRSYEMARHGLARRLTFDLVEHEADHALFRLVDSDATRAAYLFPFALDADYRIAGETLIMAMTVRNTGPRDMPVSFGFHPGFAWPLPYGQPRAAHRIVFDQPEPDPLAALDGALIAPETHATPVEDNILILKDNLFENDALIWPATRSRGCLYGAPEGPNLRIDWSDMPSLGIWTKPGAPYICIEPWEGHADPVGFTGEIWDKPGIRRLPPGEAHHYCMSMSLQMGA